MKYDFTYQEAKKKVDYSLIHKTLMQSTPNMWNVYLHKKEDKKEKTEQTKLLAIFPSISTLFFVVKVILT